MSDSPAQALKIVLRTERLLLRLFTEDDAANLQQLENDPELLRHGGRGPLARDLEGYRRYIRTAILPYHRRPEGHGVWAVHELKSDEFIGVFSLRPALDSRIASAMLYSPDQVEIGYVLRRASWGLGYATELVRAVLHKAFTELGAESIVASVSVANVASIRVLEKVGFQRVDMLFHLPGQGEPSAKYTRTRSELDAGRE